jgi:hypothetical protein
MRKHWDLPPEQSFSNTGTDWLQVLLSSCDVKQRNRTLMLLWRSWHLRCDITHGKGDETIARSVAFLLRYDKDLQCANTNNSNFAGKYSCNSPANAEQVCPPGCNDKERIYKSHWVTPREGNLKINVDAAFNHSTGEAAVGIIARNHMGQVAMAASLLIGKCTDVEEAEACAIREGLKLGLQYSLKPEAIESDSVIAVAASNKTKAVASSCWGVYKDIEYLRALSPDCIVIKTRRSCNVVAHELAKMATASGDSNVWLPPVPTRIVELCVKDYCKNLSEF